MYEKYYANKPHQKARSTTQKTLSTVDENIEPRIFPESSERKPKRQEHKTVHPSRYNLPIGIKFADVLLKILLQLCLLDNIMFMIIFLLISN